MQGKTTKKHDKNGQIAFFKIFELFILIIWAKDVPLKYLSPVKDVGCFECGFWFWWSVFCTLATGFYWTR